MILNLLKTYQSEKVYINIRLKSGNEVDGFITRITWDDMDDVIHIQHPLTKTQSSYTLEMIDNVSIVKL